MSVVIFEFAKSFVAGRLQAAVFSDAYIELWKIERDGHTLLDDAEGLSVRYSERLAEAGIEPSVGSKGDSYDNALAETINGLYKAEVIHRRTVWKTKESVELATLTWVAWFNEHRLLAPIGYIPPAEAEANYYRNIAEQAALAA
ncbi:hypothetical protein ACVWWJ_003398 [Luteibacter sp. HA06]|jgi:hypothetical protein